ncbi:MAG TPA: class I SAM-dependent methyltransferase [Phycisphaerae bacterium]|nr:class I SAM-dependent methyltransferase [Phycisphaerae bacterium]HNU43862.1 class I SAM-dependent methyltransferase [Phycisphaerae bacterium]
MSARVCPHWIGYLLAGRLRRLVHKPAEILGRFVTAGMTVLDIGPGLGFFTLPLADMVGRGGKVVAVDVQESMLSTLQQRAAARGLADRILPRVSKPTSLCLDDLAGQIDFALAFAVVHEIPDAAHLFAEIRAALKPSAACLIAEPRLHVSGRSFRETLAAAEQARLNFNGGGRIRWCHSALLRRGQLP